jgi:hypothetical protein
MTHAPFALCAEWCYNGRVLESAHSLGLTIWPEAWARTMGSPGRLSVWHTSPPAATLLAGFSCGQGKPRRGVRF